MRRALAGALVAGALAAGCATRPVPLEPVGYPGRVSTTSELVAVVKLQSGAVRGATGTALVPAGSIIVPVPTGPLPHLQFGVDDQRTFTTAFRHELQRLKLVREALPEDKAVRADIGIQIIFAQTQHVPGAREYVLDVAMEIIGGKEPFLRQYRASSAEGDSTLERLRTSSREGKAKAAQRLMEMLIPDVAEYVARNQQGADRF